MRCSFTAVLAALPALAAAQESPFEQYQAQFQNFLGQLSSYIPNPATHDPVAALEAKTGELKLHTLTLGNWQETLYEPVAADATKPEEWWVLVSGRNNTCFGRCDNIETAFNQTAGKFAVLPGAPHMAYLNCDDQPILCNSWSTATASLFVFEMLPKPAPIDVYKTRLNLTTTTSETLFKFYESGSKEEFTQVTGWFHPFNGQIAEFGLSVPFGYLTWGLGLIPNWLFMLLVSFGSRTMMGRRMQPNQGQGRPAAAAPQ